MSDTPDAPVSYERNGDVAVIRLDDGKANALSHQVIDALDNALDQAEADRAGAVVVVGRTGMFSAGFHLPTMQSGVEQARDLLRAGAELGFRIFSFPVPVVLAVTGHALAMGAILLMSADTRVGADGSFKIGLNEVAIGMPVPKFVTELADHRLSRAQLTAAVNHARIYAPTEAVGAGYLDEVVAADAVEAAAIEHAAQLAATLNHTAFGITRTNLREPTAARMKAGLVDDLQVFKIEG